MCSTSFRFRRRYTMRPSREIRCVSALCNSRPRLPRKLPVSSACGRAFLRGGISPERTLSNTLTQVRKFSGSAGVQPSASKLSPPFLRSASWQSEQCASRRGSRCFRKSPEAVVSGLAAFEGIPGPNRAAIQSRVSRFMGRVAPGARVWRDGTRCPGTCGPGWHWTGRWNGVCPRNVGCCRRA